MCAEVEEPTAVAVNELTADNVKFDIFFHILPLYAHTRSGSRYP